MLRRIMVQTGSHAPHGWWSPGGPTRSTTERLGEKRYAAAGDRAYLVGTTDGRFPAMGRHIRGKMGGIWAPPIRLLDGYWFALDDGWLAPAARFTSGAGFVRLEIPSTAGLEIIRTEFAPDGLPVVLVGLGLHNPADATRRFRLTLSVHSSLLGAYPWTETEPSAAALNRPDEAGLEDGRLVFRASGRPWQAVVGAAAQPSHGAAGERLHPPSEAPQRAGEEVDPMGAPGELAWEMEIDGGGELTHWIAIAGSHTAHGEAEEAFAYALDDPERLLREKVEGRVALLGRSRFILPEPALEAALDWSTLNMADLRRTVTQVRVRDVQKGETDPPAAVVFPSLTGICDGFPDFCRFYGTGGRYLVHPLLITGMWESARAHLRLLRDVSRVINGNTGKVIHEMATDGSVYFGGPESPGDTNEAALFAAAVDLVWRWSGDDEFRDEMYDFVKQGLRYITSEVDVGRGHWPLGNGISERPGMGSAQIDVATSTIEGLEALAHMARHRGDTETASWASELSGAMKTAFETEWWVPSEGLYAESRCGGDDAVPDEKRREQGWTNVCERPGQRLVQRIWTGLAPIVTNVAAPEHAGTALDHYESPAFSGPSGIYLAGEGGGPDGKAVRMCWGVGTGLVAIAEASYGRLSDGQVLRFIRTLAQPLDLEQPGALPEVWPSPDYDPFGSLLERQQFMQGWSIYGVSWTIVHLFLGIDPDLPSGWISVTPMVPPAWPGLSVQSLPMGEETAAVSATRDDFRFTTRVAGPAGLQLRIGHVLPHGSVIRTVTLDGQPVEYAARETVRGLRVEVDTTTDLARLLVVTIAGGDRSAR